MSVLKCTHSHYVNITAIVSQWIAPNHQTVHNATAGHNILSGKYIFESVQCVM